MESPKENETSEIKIIVKEGKEIPISKKAAGIDRTN